MGCTILGRFGHCGLYDVELAQARPNYKLRAPHPCTGVQAECNPQIDLRESPTGHPDTNAAWHGVLLSDGSNRKVHRTTPLPAQSAG